jgi:hypothetical protein
VEARAERKYGQAGCGLGSLIMKPQSAQSSAAITNGSFGNQTLAITSGTSNCVPSGKGSAMNEMEQQNFFVANFSTLSKEIAQGNGETVTGFAGVLGCDQVIQPQVAAALQADYAAIFAQPGAVAAFDKATGSLRADADIDAHCATL